MSREPTPPEQPRSEPEIIPPRRPRGADIWTSHEERASHRIYVARIGPFSALLIALALVFAAAIVLLLVIGTFLIWIPIAAVLIAVALISTWWRRTFRRR
jgi:Flp pilus assembly protein TadB